MFINQDLRVLIYPIEVCARGDGLEIDFVDEAEPVQFSAYREYYLRAIVLSSGMSKLVSVYIHELIKIFKQA